MKNKIVEFFDRVEEKLEGNRNKNRMKRGMGTYTSRKIAGAFTAVGMDLLLLISWVTGIELLVDMSIIVLIIIAFISTEICCHCLNKRIKAQETEELAEDLEDDIARIAYTIAIVAVIAFFISAWLIYR